MWDYLPMESQNPEDRVAELERQLAEAKVAQLQRQLAEVKGAQLQQSHPEPDGRGDAVWDVRGLNPHGMPGSLDTRLADAPRKVPAGFRLAEVLPFRWWYVWVLFMVAVAPISLWLSYPVAVAPAAVLALVGIYAFQFRAARTRLALLTWGQVATVTGTTTLSRGTYYSGVTYRNAVMPVAHGWTVTRPPYSGPKTKTRVGYTLGDYQGELVVGGREYIDGVILADQRHPARARCVTSFAYDLDRDTDGNWVGAIRSRLKLGMACWVLIVVGWLALAGFAAAHAATAGKPMTAAPGGTVKVGGTNQSTTIACNDNKVTVSGITNTVTITGHCRSLTVSGSKNHITVDNADVIDASGTNNQIVYHSGAPQITKSGISNAVQQG